MRVNTPPFAPAPGSSTGDTLVYNSVTNNYGPLSLVDPPAGTRGRHIISQFDGQADGTLVTAWPEVNGAYTLANAGGAERPSLVTDPEDGIRAMRFDGVGNFLRFVGLASPAAPNLTVFIVAQHYGLGVPWSLGRAGVVSSAAGCTRGIIGGASFCFGGMGQNLGGATARSAGKQMQDSGDNSAGVQVRRAYAFEWRDLGGGFIGLFAHMGEECARVLAGAVANFTYTTVVLGAENNGGGAPANFTQVDISDFNHYSSATPVSRAAIRTELARLRALYSAY